VYKTIENFSPSIVDSCKYMQILNDDFNIDNFLHYPLLINNDGSLWKYGNLYLLSKLKVYTKPSSKTLDSIATDLKNFKEWCDAEDVDYLKTPRKVLRPTYMYRGYLQELLRDGKISANTVKRRISAVIGFYKYLVSPEKLNSHFQYL